MERDEREGLKDDGPFEAEKRHWQNRGGWGYGQVRGKVLSLLLVDLNVRSGDCMWVERSRRC